jgi:hypothetical protein
MTTSHITRVLDLTYISRSQRSEFEKNYEVGVFFLLFVLECCNILWVFNWVPSTSTPNFGPIGFQIWPPGTMSLALPLQCIDVILWVYVFSPLVLLTNLSLPFWRSNFFQCTQLPSTLPHNKIDYTINKISNLIYFALVRTLR